MSQQGPSSTRTLDKNVVNHELDLEDLFQIDFAYAGWTDKQTLLGIKWPRVYTKRYLRLWGGFYPRIGYASDEKTSSRRERALVPAETDMIRVASLKLHIVWTSLDEPETWIFKFRTRSMRDRWYRKLHDTIDLAKWLTTYQLGPVIGQGGSGVVVRANDADGHTYAIKIVRTLDRMTRRATKQEIRRHRALSGMRDIVQLIDAQSFGTQTWIVLEYCAGGSFETYFLASNRPSLTEKQVREILKKLAQALESLHQHNILHMDITLGNILLQDAQDPLKVKLADLGACQNVQPSSVRLPIVSTMGYAAPEVLNGQSLSYAADVYSLGVVLYALMHRGKLPDLAALKRPIMEGTDISNIAFDLVERMLHPNPSNRITLANVLNHEWLV